MMLEAVWFRDGKEIKTVSPVTCFMTCYNDFDNIKDIEIEESGGLWHMNEEADDFVIRIKRD